MKRNFIKEIINHENLTPEDLASIIKVNKSTVYRWLSEGQDNIKLGIIKNISSSLDINMNWFFDRKSVYRKSIVEKIIDSNAFKVPILKVDINKMRKLLLDNNMDSDETYPILLNWLDSEPQKYFFIRITDDSLISFNINKNSLLLFKKKTELLNDEIGLLISDRFVFFGKSTTFQKVTVIDGVNFSNDSGRVLNYFDETAKAGIIGVGNLIKIITDVNFVD